MRNVEPTRAVTLPLDAEIVAGLGAGDPQALELLVGAYWGSLTRYAEGIVTSPGRGDDVVQEVFIRLWTRRQTLAGRGSLRSLLYTMTRNAAIDERRRERRDAERAAACDPPAPGRSPLENAVERELRERAAAAITALPTRRQEVFRLVREGGLSYQEVADVMEISLQTVANHMSLALASLRETLAPTLGEAIPGPGMVEPGTRFRVIGG